MRPVIESESTGKPARSSRILKEGRTQLEVGRRHRGTLAAKKTARAARRRLGVTLRTMARHGATRG
jgi:hypothetical protein